jgi:CheY-like chemotaxis protein
MTKILVVDDSAVDRRVVSGLLEQRPGFEVSCAEDGTNALLMMEQSRPDIVVTDLNMPQKNGLELVRAMRVHFGGIPVILITAQGSEALAVQALEQGAASYVPKSLLADKLADTIDDVMAVATAKQSYDRLVGSIDRTEFDFTLENDPDLFDPLIELFQEITHGMKICDDTDRFRMGMALKEALLNALYRGNLEIDSVLSHDAQAAEGAESAGEDDLRSLVADRLKDTRYSSRRIYMQIKIDPKQAEFKIRDEGKGFDVKNLPSPGDLGSLDADTGRGIVLMRAFMDKVTFNRRGNEVTLVKRSS